MLRLPFSTRSLVACALLTLILPSVSDAQLTKEELLELGASDLDIDEMVNKVEAECVDFEVNPAALAELAGKVPRTVLQAAIDCGGPQGESREWTFAAVGRVFGEVDELPHVGVALQMSGREVVGDELGGEAGLAAQPPEQGVPEQQRRRHGEQQLAAGVALPKVGELVQQHGAELLAAGARGETLWQHDGRP